MGVLVDNKTNTTSTEAVKDNPVNAQQMNGQIPTQINGQPPQQVCHVITFECWIRLLKKSLNCCCNEVNKCQNSFTVVIKISC